MMLNESKPAPSLLFKPPMNHHQKSIYTSVSKKASNNANLVFTSTPHSTSASSTKVQLSVQPQQNTVITQVANPVVIVHQNQSRSRNSTSCQPPPQIAIEQQVLQKLDTTDKDRVNNNADDPNEVKYMKGYVNVIKERFTRKSMEKNENLMSAGLLNLSSSGNDFLRRRSVSPFGRQLNHDNASHRLSSVVPTRNEVKIIHANVNNPNCGSITDARKLFASTDDLRNSSKVIGGNHTSHSHHHNHHAGVDMILLNGHCSDLVKNKIKYLSHSTLNTTGVTANASSATSLVSTEIAKLNGHVVHTHAYEKIARDEMPKPNFVSSVKNLFEKQMSSVNYSLNNSLNSSSSNANIVNVVNNESVALATAALAAGYAVSKSSPPPPPPQPAMQSANSAAGVVTVKHSTVLNNAPDGLVDKLRQNGTLVYEHSDLISNGNKTESNEPITTTTATTTTTTITSTNSNMQATTNISANFKSFSNSSTKLFSPRTGPDQQTPPQQLVKSAVPTVLKPAPPPLPSTLPPQTSHSLLNHNQPKKTPLTASSSNMNNNNNSSPLIANSSNNSNNSNANQNESDKENNDEPPSSKHETLSSSNSNSASNGGSNNNNRVLSIKERKEFFSKKQPSASSSSLYEKNNSSGLRMQKRLRVENNNSEEASSGNEDNVGKSSETLVYATVVSNRRHEDSIMDNEQSNHNHVLNNGDIDDEEASYDQPDAEGSISANNIFTSAKQKQQDKDSKSKTSVKLKTFFGGEEIKNIEDLKSMRVNNSPNNGKLNITSTSTSAQPGQQSVEYLNFEFIGAGVKLEKSILIVSTSMGGGGGGSGGGMNTTQSNGVSRSKKKKVERVNFMEAPETYEYPSYEFMLKEMGIDPSSDPDYQIVPLENGHADETTEDRSIINKPSYTQFLPGLVTNGSDSSTDENASASNDSDKNFTKLGSFTNFKPSWHTMNYELGSMESMGASEQRQIVRLSGSVATAIPSASAESADILPSKDDEVKRWSCDMDSNILF